MSVSEEMLQILREIRDILKANFPGPTSVEAYYAGTHTCPAGAITTITWEVAVGYKVKVKKLYADAAPDCTYEWLIAGQAVGGNELKFSMYKEVKRPGTIQLKVTNSGAVDEDLDVVIDGWAVKEVS